MKFGGAAACWWRRVNWIMLLAMLSLITIGTIAIWSAGNARQELVFHGMWVSNIATAAFGLAVYGLLAYCDYRKYLEVFALPAYIAALLMLIAVLIFGDTIYGGRRWLWFFQPSEISKLCILAFLASKLKACGFKGFMMAALIIGVPALLILAEPDLGTTLTLLPAAMVMLFVAKVWRKGLIIMISVGAVAALLIMGAVYEAERPGVSDERRESIRKFLPLKDHQIQRVKVFLFPEQDITGAGYNLRQAKISIGSGGLTGKGIRKGETNHLKYLPQAISMNDFIFCVYAEETGYVGSLLLLSLFAMLLVPICWVAYVAKDSAGRLMALGVATLIFAHVYINIAMSVGLVPITGLPLPFISSGRTFLLTIMAALGIVQSVSIYGREELT